MTQYIIFGLVVLAIGSIIRLAWLYDERQTVTLRLLRHDRPRYACYPNTAGDAAGLDRAAVQLQLLRAKIPTFRPWWVRRHARSWCRFFAMEIRAARREWWKEQRIVAEISRITGS